MAVTETRGRDRARERPAARRARPRRPAPLAGPAEHRSRGAGRRRATSCSSTTTGRPATTPGTSTRSTWRRSRDAPPADVVRGDVSAAGLRAEVAFEHGDRPGQHDAPGGAAGRRLAPAGVPLRGRLARVAHDAEGAVPGRRPRRPTRPTRCSSGTPSGRRTTRPATTWPATRCPATASPTCPSTASAWRS